MATIAPPKVTTPQQMIRTWIKEWSEDRDSIDNDEMLEAARERFSDDDDFRSALIDSALNEMVPDEARKVFGRQRRIALGDENVTREEFDRRVAADDRWRRWRRAWESVGEGRRVRLIEMNKADLEATITARHAQLQGDTVQLGFLRELEKHLTGKKTVQQHFTPQELDAIHDRIRKAVLKENA